jgi:hypothetical protein
MLLPAGMLSEAPDGMSRAQAAGVEKNRKKAAMTMRELGIIQFSLFIFLSVQHNSILSELVQLRPVMTWLLPAGSKPPNNVLMKSQLERRLLDLLSLG